MDVKNPVIPDQGARPATQVAGSAINSCAFAPAPTLKVTGRRQVQFPVHGIAPAGVQPGEILRIDGLHFDA